MKPLHIIAAALALTAPQAAGAQTMDIQRHGDTTIVNIDIPYSCHFSCFVGNFIGNYSLSSS